MLHLKMNESSHPILPPPADVAILRIFPGQQGKELCVLPCVKDCFGQGRTDHRRYMLQQLCCDCMIVIKAGARARSPSSKQSHTSYYRPHRQPQATDGYTHKHSRQNTVILVLLLTRHGELCTGCCFISYQEKKIDFLVALIYDDQLCGSQQPAFSAGHSSRSGRSGWKVKAFYGSLCAFRWLLTPSFRNFVVVVFSLLLICE